MSTIIYIKYIFYEICKNYIILHFLESKILAFNYTILISYLSLLNKLKS